MLTAADQLEAIHSMLSAGHRSIRMPRHSLILWGISGAVLCLGTDYLINPERFPVPWQLALALLLFLAFALSGVAVADFQYTRHRLRSRQESLPFAHTQITKVWWLLVMMGILFTFGTQFFGGGYMVFVAWLVLFGLGIYIHGLFSEQILEWAGVVMILLGVGALALPAPYVATKWLAASVFGLGMPLLSAMLDRGQSRSPWTRALQSALWLAVVLAPVFAAYQWWKASQVPAAPSLSLESFVRGAQVPGLAVVSLPAGTSVPLQVRIGGDVVEDRALSGLHLTLAHRVEVLLEDGQLTGRFRIGDGAWKRRQSLWIQHVELRGSLSPGVGPAVSLSLMLTADH